jgi:hypothetical protein
MRMQSLSTQDQQQNHNNPNPSTVQKKKHYQSAISLPDRITILLKK